MGKVMKADASVDLAFAQFDFGSPQGIVWETFDLAFDDAALAYFTSNASNDFCDLLESPGGAVDISFFMQSALWTLLVQLTNQSATPTPLANTWKTCEVGFDNSTGTGWLYIDGSLILTDSNAFLIGVEMGGFTVGQNNGGEATADVVVYVKNVFAGTSRGASDLFPSDGFSGGDFSAWTSTFGDVSVIDDPFAASVFTLPGVFDVAFTDPTLEAFPTWTAL